jgi:hypothetical protein
LNAHLQALRKILKELELVFGIRIVSMTQRAAANALNIRRAAILQRH